MTFKVFDLSIKATAGGDHDTCSGVTRITGCIVDSIFQAASPSAGSRNLSILKGQLRQTLNRA